VVKLQIPREMVAGFEPDSRAVSSLLPTPRTGRRERGRDSRVAPASERRNAVVDPIFREPYRPAAEGVAQHAVSSAPAAPRKPARQVAALLGGLNVKKG
jgi:hypothetical protein